MELIWKNTKKGHRSGTRRPRQPKTSSSEMGVEVDNEMQNSTVLKSEKFGISVLGQHFAADKTFDVPIKKRKLLRQSVSPPPPTLCLNGEGPLSSQPQTPSPFHEERGQLVGRTHASLSASPGKKEVSDLDDFSGIELLAAAACKSSIYDNTDHMELAPVMEEHQTPGVNACSVGIKETIATSDSDGSSVQDSMVPVIHDNGNGGEDKKLASSKCVRLHWDLNTVMDEWEEPFDDSLVDPRPQIEGVYDDDMQKAELNLEGEQGSMQKNVDCKPSSVKLESLLTESYQLEKHDATSPIVPLIKQEVVSIQAKNGDSFVKTCALVEDTVSSKDVIGTITCKTSDAESCPSKSDVVDSFIHPAKSENKSISTTSFLQGQTIVKGELGTIHEPSNIMSKSISADVVPDACESPKLCKSDGDNKLTPEDHLSDCCGSNVSQAEGNTMVKVHAGYDSPFEDGELREPIGAWEENEAEDRDCVDYESDNLYEDDFDAIKYPISVKNEVTCDHGQTMGVPSSLLKEEVQEKIMMVGNAVPNNEGAKADAFKRPNCLSVSKASGYQLQEHYKNVILEEDDIGSREVLPDRKSFRGVDRSSSFDVHRNGAYIPRSRSGNFGDCYSRGERHFGEEKFMRRDRLTYQGRGSHWVDSSSMGAWDSRKSHGYPRSKNGDVGVRSGGSSGFENDQARNYNPKGTYRRQSSERNDSYGTYRGAPLMRGLSRERCSNRGSGIHPQRLRRAPEEEYHEPEPCYLERKAPCFSSNFNRSGHLSRSRRRSRSGSRSGSPPIAWRFQKGTNVDMKRQSPDNRPEARVPGEKLALRKPSFSGEVEAGFESPTRGRMSPQRNPRSFDGRNFDDQFRERRSPPVRMFQRNQRLEPMGYHSRRNKTDDHHNPRPAPYHGRLQQMSGPRSSEGRYESNSRIRGGKYGTINRVRRYEEDENGNGVKRFRYSSETRNEEICLKDAAAAAAASKRETANERLFSTAPMPAGEQDFDKGDEEQRREA